MHRPDMLINVGRLLAAQSAVRTLVPRRFAALVSKMAQHSIPSPVSVITIWTVKFPGKRVVQHVPSSRVLPRMSDKRGVVMMMVVMLVVMLVVVIVIVVVVVVVESVTYKTSYYGQDHGQGRWVGRASTIFCSLKHRLRGHKNELKIENKKQGKKKHRGSCKRMGR